MTTQPMATTEAGECLLALAEWLADEVTSDPATHRVVVEMGFLAAPVPEELGGLGVSDERDLRLACERLARGDSALAAAVREHLDRVLGLRRSWDAARAAGDVPRERALADSLRAVARGRYPTPSSAVG